MLVRIFVLLDRRVGKRRLHAMKADIEKECKTIQCFYAIRAAAENVI